MLKTYPAIFHKEGGGYWVEFPDFGGGTEGSDLEAAMINAREMLEGILASYLDDGIKLPTSTDIQTLKVTDGFATLIQANPTPFLKNSRAIRKTAGARKSTAAGCSSCWHGPADGQCTRPPRSAC